MNNLRDTDKKEWLIQKEFKPYIVKQANNQCQVLIPLIELNDLCKRIKQRLFYEFCEECDEEKKQWEEFKKTEDYKFELSYDDAFAQWVKELDHERV